MYVPPRFQVKDLQIVKNAIAKHPFCTLLSKNEISHLPLILADNSDSLRLEGHMAKMNPQWQDLQNNSDVTVLVHGPNSYVTSSWYEKNDVPTWNYLAIHLKGTLKLIDDYEGLTGILKKSTAHFETTSKNPWEFEIPEDLAGPGKLLRAIGGFEIKVTDIQAKMKISQNRSPVDRQNVIKGLSTERNDENSRAIAELMKKYL